MSCTSSFGLKLSLVLEEEDLLTLILLRVPWRKLMSLKCVSSKWLSLITSPQFTRLRNIYMLPLRAASGLFIQRPPILEFRRPCPDKVYFLPLDDTTTNPFRIPTFAHDPFDPQRIRILLSCNGLLFCSTCLFAPREHCNRYIYNPSTNQLAILPEHPAAAHAWVDCIGLAFDPSKSLHYKVIAFVHTSQAPSVGDFHIYSSETGTWRVSVQSFHCAPDMLCFDGGVYWHGCIHWLINLYVKRVPDSAVSDCLYFNVDEGRIQTFPRPPIAVESTSKRSVYFGESGDHLHFTKVCPYTTSLRVYEMKSDYSEWLIKYQIDLAPLSNVFSEMTCHKACLIYGYKYAVAVLSIIRRENFQEDSFLVLEIPGKAIRYNLVDKSFKVIWDFAVDFGLEQVDRWAFGRLKVWEYIETLSWA